MMAIRPPARRSRGVVAGDDEPAKAEVTALLGEFGGRRLASSTSAISAALASMEM